ncbi:Kinetochore protein Spc25 [Astathelohania contejeani]|uniref:Kinetochore protein Spc25 n=1 Tax=Astathelohania contejeani TaxID=164912 RepID=A0ABQ7HZ96_9MICR|nr:Kinetochore protein Spc25 [Thelohania contejeani]
MNCENSQKISQITEQVVSELEQHLSLYKNHILHFKEADRRDVEGERARISSLNQAYALARERNEALIKERNSLNEAIEAEKKELSAHERENSDLKNQVTSAGETRIQLAGRLASLENKLFSLTKKCELVESKNKEKEKKLEIKANLYREYLGIDILPLKENVLKIEFRYVIDGDCFVVFNFDNTSPISEIFPSILSLEKVNYKLEESKNFYSFLKWIRNEFKTRFK